MRGAVSGIGQAQCVGTPAGLHCPSCAHHLHWGCEGRSERMPLLWPVPRGACPLPWLCSPHWTNCFCREWDHARFLTCVAANVDRHLAMYVQNAGLVPVALGHCFHGLFFPVDSLCGPFPAPASCLMWTLPVAVWPVLEACPHSVQYGPRWCLFLMAPRNTIEV